MRVSENSVHRKVVRAFVHSVFVERGTGDWLVCF